MADKQYFPVPRWEDDVLEEQYTVTVMENALTAALNVMLFGEIGQANRIIDLLYKHDDLEYDTAQTRIFMHYAWNASGSWPSHITKKDPAKLLPASKRMIEDQGGEDGPLLIPHLQGLSRKSWADVLDKDAADVEWKFGDFQKARELAASQDMRRESGFPASVELALELEMDDVAGELVREHLVSSVTEIFKWTPQRLEVLHSPRLWGLLCDGWLRREMRVEKVKISEWVDEVVRLLEQRLTDGPRRPLRDHTVEQLVHLFNEACLKNRRLGGNGATSCWPDNEVDPDDPSTQLPKTFLSPPATEAEIADLDALAKEKGYAEGIPEDYKSFLRITNGIYPPGSPDAGDIFRPIDSLVFDEGAHLEVELIPFEATGAGLEVEFEWLCLGDYTIDLGAAGDEGWQYLVSKELTAEAVAEFKEVYDEAGPADRKRIERAAKDIYGGIDELMKVESLILRSYHWAPETEVLLGFKHLLEVSTMEAINGPSERDDDPSQDDDVGENGSEDEDDEPDEASDSVSSKRARRESKPSPQTDSPAKRPRRKT